MGDGACFGPYKKGNINKAIRENVNKVNEEILKASDMVTKATIERSLRKTIMENEEKCNECERISPTTMIIDIGYGPLSYQYGNYLNALEELTLYFSERRECSEDLLADCLEMYAKYLREGY
jgi:hypothetical protein